MTRGPGRSSVARPARPTAAATAAVRRVAAGLLLVALAVLGAPAQAPAAEAALGTARVALPDEGWTRQDLSDGIVLRRGQALLLVSAPRSRVGSFDAAFDAFANGFAFVRDRPRDRRGRPERPLTTRRGETADGHDSRFEQFCCSNRTNARVLGVDAPTGRVFLALVTIRAERAEEDAAKDAFAAVARSLRPGPGDRGFALTPPPGAGGLDGVFSRTATGLMPNAFGGLDMTVDQKVLAFDPSGLYATVPPAAGSIAEECAARPRNCGTYVLRSDEIETREVADDFGTLERERRLFERTPDGGVTVGGHAHRPVPPAPRALEGTWRYFWASSGSTAFSSGGASSEQVLTLTRDGRYRRTGWSGYSGSNETGGTRTSVVTGGPRGEEAGRYEVEGYRITFVADDGRREVTGLLAPDPGSDGLLVIGGRNFLKREGTGASPPRGAAAATRPTAPAPTTPPPPRPPAATGGGGTGYAPKGAGEGAAAQTAPPAPTKPPPL